jgi:membrane-associated phospholipid phosphatase
MNLWNSFPSGHTMAAFGLYAALAFYAKKWYQAFGLFFLALLVGYSRIYLSQHFLVDVIFGAMLGCLAALVGFAGANRFTANGLDKPLLN